MIRRGFSILAAAALGLGVLIAPGGAPAHADNFSPTITNISVGVSNGIVTYYICVLPGSGTTPPDSPPAGGGAVVEPQGAQSPQYAAALNYQDQGCGSGTYLLQGSFAGLPAGAYDFRAATVDFYGPSPSVDPGSAFTANGTPVGQGCQVNFNTGVSMAPRNCSMAGTIGDLTQSGPPPPPASTNTPVPPPPPASNTPVPPPLASNTPVPPATNTPVPAPNTNTPVPPPPPTSTPVPASPGSSGGSTPVSSGNQGSPPPAATPTSVPPAPGHSAPPRRVHPTAHRGPALRVSLRAARVQPGATQYIDVSYSAGALVHATIAFPGLRAISLYGTTNSHGYLTFSPRVPRGVALRDGHATAPLLVSAMAGSWLPITAFNARLRPAATAHIDLRGPALTLIRATIMLPGRPTITLYNTTDRRGGLTLAVPIPSHLATTHGRVDARVALWRISATQQAQVRRALAISDMLVSMTPGAISDCRQTQVVRVSYWPNVPLRVTLLFPGKHGLTLQARTDALGAAAVRVNVTYTRAASPLRVSVQAVDARPQAHRLEQTAISIALPQACQPPTNGSITVGG